MTVYCPFDEDTPNAILRITNASGNINKKKLQIELTERIQEPKENSI